MFRATLWIRRVVIMCLKSEDEREDQAELRDPKVKASIAASQKDYLAGKTRPAQALLAELQQSTNTTN